jgi:pimeloyl-ACP methyl ester carboxylesterase
VSFVSTWLETAHGFAPSRQGILGTSLGGHVAAIAAGAYPERFRAGVFLLAGSHVHRTFLEPNGTTDRIRAVLMGKGVTADEAVPFLARLDPGAYGRPERKDDVLLIACRDDPVIPRENVESLAGVWGGARIVWFDGDHYGLLRHLGEVFGHLTRHFVGRFAGP